jgi:alpha-1,2-mannosyltransferase
MPSALVAAMASAPVLKNAQLGYNGFLTAGLFGLTLVFLERRPWLSRILLGLLTYKPQFGVYSHWRCWPHAIGGR